MVSKHILMLGALAAQISARPAVEPRESQSCNPSNLSSSSLDEAFAAAVPEKRVPGIAALALNRDGSIVYKNSWGTIDINDPSSSPITSSTKMNIASMTKAVVTIAALQLLEQDKLSLDDLVEGHLPSWKNIFVLDGFTPSGEPILRPPKTKATVLNLFTHTTGQAYWFINDDIAKYSAWASTQPKGSVPSNLLAADPGTGWFYGYSIDTLGNIIESITGLRLDDYIEHNIFRPLGITNSGLITPDIYTHRRPPNGVITSVPPTPGNKTTATPGGGGYLISTLDDYSTFLLTLLNWGTHPQSGVTILKSSTVKKYVFTDLIPASLNPSLCAFSQKTPNGDAVGVWNSNNQTMSLSAEFLPGTKKGWSASFLTNNEDIKGRRKAGSGAWAGIHNLFYWVDITSGKLGVVFTNLQPFLDPEVLGLFDKLEEFVYAS